MTEKYFSELKLAGLSPPLVLNDYFCSVHNNKRVLDYLKKETSAAVFDISSTVNLKMKRVAVDSKWIDAVCSSEFYGISLYTARPSVPKTGKEVSAESSHNDLVKIDKMLRNNGLESAFIYDWDVLFDNFCAAVFQDGDASFFCSSVFSPCASYPLVVCMFDCLYLSSFNWQKPLDGVVVGDISFEKHRVPIQTLKHVNNDFNFHEQLKYYEPALNFSMPLAWHKPGQSHIPKAAYQIALKMLKHSKPVLKHRGINNGRAPENLALLERILSDVVREYIVKLVQVNRICKIKKLDCNVTSAITELKQIADNSKSTTELIENVDRYTTQNILRKFCARGNISFKTRNCSECSCFPPLVI